MLKKVISIVLTLVAVFSLSACEKTPDVIIEDAPPEHVHQYLKGVCECGDIDKNYSTLGLNYELTNGEYYTVVSYSGEDKKVMIPEQYEGKPVKAISDMAFQGMMNKLTKINLPTTLESIGEYAFQACTNLKELTLYENLKFIGNYAFEDCFNIQTITYKATLLEVGTNVFDKMGTGLEEGTKLVVASNVEKLPDNFFYGKTYNIASNLTSVEFEDNSKCKEIGTNCFFNCRALVSIDFGQNPALEKIGHSAFGNCTAIKKITVPSSIKVIDKYAFSATNSLTEIIMESASEWEIAKVSKVSGVENIEKIAQVSVSAGENVVDKFKNQLENYNSNRWIKK